MPDPGLTPWAIIRLSALVASGALDLQFNVYVIRDLQARSNQCGLQIHQKQPTDCKSVGTERLQP